MCRCAGLRIQIPARKPRFLRYSSVEDVHPLPPHALDPALPRAALRLAQDLQHFGNFFFKQYRRGTVISPAVLPPLRL